MPSWRPLYLVVSSLARRKLSNARSLRSTIVPGGFHRVQKLSSGGGEIFRTRPDRPWGPPSLLYTMGTGSALVQTGPGALPASYIQWVPGLSLPGLKRQGRGVNLPPQSSVEVKERAELYLYSPSGSSWSVLWIALTLPLPFTAVIKNVPVLEKWCRQWCVYLCLYIQLFELFHFVFKFLTL